jgi:histidine triad (HIT) family protein
VTSEREASVGDDVQHCIFCRIVRGEVPARKVYEDDEVLAFHDIHPVAPVHFMLVPKRHIASLAEATMDDAPVLGRMLALTGRLAREQGSPDGFRTVVNTGRIARQDVMHVHIHVIGGPERLGLMVPPN